LAKEIPVAITMLALINKVKIRRTGFSMIPFFSLRNSLLCIIHDLSIIDRLSWERRSTSGEESQQYGCDK